METTNLIAGTQIIDECPFCHKSVVIAAVGFDCLYCRIHLLPLSGNRVAVIKEESHELWIYALPFWRYMPPPTILERILRWLLITILSAELFIDTIKNKIKSKGIPMLKHGALK